MHALLNCCLKVHFDIISTDDELMGRVRELRQASSAAYTRTDDLINHNICMISNFTGVQLSSNSFNL